MTAIELKGVTKIFKTGDTDTVALRDVTLNIEQGEFVAIMGPSGSGKSTLMNILGLLDTPSEGDYLLDGQPVRTKKDRQLAKLRRHKIGFVFQTFNLLARLTVLQNLILPMIYGRVPARQRKAKALDLLKRVGLEHRAGYRTNQISGGETQRVAIARALANNPTLILADEPTGNLDSKSSHGVIELLKSLNEAVTTLIIVTHNPEIAAQAHRVIEIRDGAVVAASTHQAPEPKPKKTKPEPKDQNPKDDRRVKL